MTKKGDILCMTYSGGKHGKDSENYIIIDAVPDYL